MLDSLLPIAEAFVSREQTRTLLDIAKLVSDDLHRDDNTNTAAGGAFATDHSKIRRMLPTISTILKSGAADSFFDLLDLLTTVPAVDGSGTMADVVVDSFEYVTRNTEPVRTRHGMKSGTSMALEMLRPYRELVTRLDDKGVKGELDTLVRHVTGYITRTTVDDRGTATPTDDRVILADRRLLPIYAAVLAFTSQGFDLTPAERDCYFTALQDSVDTFLASPDFATVVSLLRAYSAAPEHPVLDRVAASWLLPQSDASRDVFGSIQQLTSALVQKQAEPLTGDALLRFAAAVMADLDGPTTMAILDELFTQDPHDTVLTLARRLLTHDLAGLGSSPLEFFTGLFVDVLTIDRLHRCDTAPRRWTGPDAGRAVVSMNAFINDDAHGLGAIFRMIGLRSNDHGN
jgi:hypothetical protein